MTQPRTVTLGENDHQREVSLRPGDKLVVQLSSNPSVGGSWHVLLNPGFPVNMVGHTFTHHVTPAGASPVVGAPGVEEFHFSVPSDKALSFSLGAWLRLLFVRPFDPTLEGARLWQVNVSIEASAVPPAAP